MLHVDIPTPGELKALITHRGDICVSIYLPTTPLTTGADRDRIELKDAHKRAIEELEEAGADKRRVAALSEHLDDLVEDEEFWRFQAHSLAVLATPDNVQTFRLPSALESVVEVADRFFLKPLMRSVAFPNACYVLALDQGPPRLIEVSAGLPAEEVKLSELPRDAASSVGKGSISKRAPIGRIQGSEGQKVRLRQFARAVDTALRAFLHGKDVPLILAATEPIEPIYRSVNTYPHLAKQFIAGSPVDATDAQLAERARPILDGIYAEQLADWAARYDVLESDGRTTSDIAQAARAATAGAVESILVDIDEIVHGTVAADGAVTFANGPGPGTYGVVDEIADRVILNGGQVLAVRKAEIPAGKSLAAILRYAI
ncbi:MAG: hypothetical protein ACLQPV_08235 [Vulcanimicrobiaceae bacterium]